MGPRPQMSSSTSLVTWSCSLCRSDEKCASFSIAWQVTASSSLTSLAFTDWSMEAIAERPSLPTSS